MADETFTDPAADRDGDEWVDIRMNDPIQGEWDVDFVVVDGQVEYVDLRVRVEFLAGFVACLLEDVGDERASEILSTIADRVDIDLPDST